MAYARHARFQAPNGRSIVDWITGTGFLALDAGAFFVALMVLLPWNLYRSPGDLWVAQPLRTWAFILTFHALVVGAIALARGIVRTPVAEPIANQPALRASSGWSAPVEPATPQRSTASARIAQEWARRWLDEDRAAHVSGPNVEAGPNARTAPVQETMRPAGAGFTPWPEPPAPAPIDAEEILADWLDEQAVEFGAPPVQEVDPLRAAADAVPTAEPAIDPQLEWKWVEAAASAWLSKRDLSANGHHDPHSQA